MAGTLVLDRADLFDPELVAALSRRDLPGPPSSHPQRGIHRSSRRGASLEFSEYTEYSHGDDLRHLDWKVYAKSDRYFVRRYEDERLQRAVLLVDASGSTRYGAVAPGLRASKYHLACRIAVAMAATLLRQGDAVGLEIAGGGAQPHLPPKGGGAQLEVLMEVLGGTEPTSTAGLTEACRLVGDRYGRATSVFVFSDFLDEGDEDLAGIRLLRARGLSPRVVHLLHADEVDLPYEDTCRFVDLEGPRSLVLDPLPIRRAYAREIRDFVRGVARRAAALGVPYAFCTGAEDPAPALGRLLRSLGRE